MIERARRLCLQPLQRGHPIKIVQRSDHSASASRRISDNLSECLKRLHLDIHETRKSLEPLVERPPPPGVEFARSPFCGVTHRHDEWPGGCSRQHLQIFRRIREMIHPQFEKVRAAFFTGQPACRRERLRRMHRADHQRPHRSFRRKS